MNLIFFVFWSVKSLMLTEGSSPSLISLTNVRIEKHHKRLEDQDGPTDGALYTESQLRIASIDAECEVLLRKIESLGEEGLVDEATACNDTLKRLRGEKDFLLRVFFFFRKIVLLESQIRAIAYGKQRVSLNLNYTN